MRRFTETELAAFIQKPHAPNSLAEIVSELIARWTLVAPPR